MKVGKNLGYCQPSPFLSNDIPIQLPRGYSTVTRNGDYSLYLKSAESLRLLRGRALIEEEGFPLLYVYKNLTLGGKFTRMQCRMKIKRPMVRIAIVASLDGNIERKASGQEK